MLKAEKRNYAKTFTLELYACEFCELCVQVCPTDAIVMMKSFDLATADRRELLLDKDRLHAIGLQLPGRRGRPATGCVTCRRRRRPREAAEGEQAKAREQGRVSLEPISLLERWPPSSLGSALAVVLSKNLFHSVLWLALGSRVHRRRLPDPRRGVPRRRADPPLRGRRHHHRGLRDRRHGAARRRAHHADEPASDRAPPSWRRALLAHPRHRHPARAAASAAAARARGPDAHHRPRGAHALGAALRTARRAPARRAARRQLLRAGRRNSDGPPGLPDPRRRALLASGCSASSRAATPSASCSASS